MTAKKIYVLDTNILLDNPECLINSFEENDLAVPLAVIEELDGLKKSQGDIGFSARQALRLIEQLRKDANVQDGVVRNEQGDTLMVMPLTTEEKVEYDTLGYQLDKNDDIIILTAMKVQKENPDSKVVLISNDTSVRIKSSLLDIPAQFYKEGSVKKESLDHKGFKDVDLPIEFFGDYDEESDTFTPYALPEQMDISEIQEFLEEDLLINEFVLLQPKECGVSKKAVKKMKAVYRLLADGVLVRKNLKYDNVYGGLSGKNLEQSVALDVLLDDDIKVVALNGPSGSGKTILSVATCLTKMAKEKDTEYEKVILLKPTVSVSDDIGFLPGGVEEKLSHYMGSYYDNFKTLKKLEITNSGTTADSFEELKEKDLIEIESISFLRGRSLSDCLIIVDEVQNLTQIAIKTILTRVGSNCKIILLGDPEQIDRPFLSKYNNGLSYLIEKLRGQEFFAHVKFLHGVRSQVSRVSSELL